MTRSAAGHDGRRQAPCLRPAMRIAPACIVRVLCGRADRAGRAAAGTAEPVCADPTNLPFTNARHEGFENRLAKLVAGNLGTISVRGSSTHGGAATGIPRSSSTCGSPCAAATRRATRCSTRSSCGAGVREQRARRHRHVINGVRPGSEWRCDSYQGVESTRIVTLTPIGRRRARQKSASSKRRIRTRRGRLPLAGKIYIPE